MKLRLAVVLHPVVLADAKSSNASDNDHGT